MNFSRFGLGYRNTLWCFFRHEPKASILNSLLLMQQVRRWIRFKCDLDIRPCNSVMYLPKTQLIEFRQLLVSEHNLEPAFVITWNLWCMSSPTQISSWLSQFPHFQSTWGQDRFLRTYFGVYILHSSCLSTFQLTARNESTVLLLLPQQ